MGWTYDTNHVSFRMLLPTSNAGAFWCVFVRYHSVPPAYALLFGVNLYELSAASRGSPCASASASSPVTTTTPDIFYEVFGEPDFASVGSYH